MVRANQETLDFLRSAKSELRLNEFQLVLKGVKPGSYSTFRKDNFPSFDFETDLKQILRNNNQLIQDEVYPNIFWFISLKNLECSYPCVVFIINSDLIDPEKYLNFLVNYNTDRASLSFEGEKKFHLAMGTLMGYHEESVSVFSNEIAGKKLRDDRIIISFGDDIEQVGFITYPEFKEGAIKLLTKYLEHSFNSQLTINIIDKN